MKHSKTACLLFLLFSAPFLKAQKTVTLEKVRCFSNLGPVMNYWRSEEIKRAFITDLSSSLLQKQQLILKDTLNWRVDIVSTGNGAANEKIAFADTDTSHFHLYLDIFELDLNSFMYLARSGLPDTSLQEKIVSMFVFKASILNSQKLPVFDEELHVAITPGETSGIGIEYNGFSGFGKLISSPRSFTQLLGKSIAILLNPDNPLELVEIKVPTAYVADNYILGRTAGYPRVVVNTKKGISTYNFMGSQEMIRLDDPLYEQIVVKGKRARPYSQAVLNAIQRAKNGAASDFIFLRQDCRDVIRNRNYLLKLMVQIDPDFMSSGTKTIFSNFMEEKIHYLLSEKDTVAAFTIRKNVLNQEGRKLFLNQVSNGLDSSSLFQVESKRSEWAVRYNYVVNGNIAGKQFTILYAGSTNRLKEILLDGKRICIAEGGSTPGKFVLFDTTLAPEMLNQLFMIAFNGFFE